MRIFPSGIIITHLLFRVIYFVHVLNFLFFSHVCALSCKLQAYVTPPLLPIKKRYMYISRAVRVMESEENLARASEVSISSASRTENEPPSSLLPEASAAGGASSRHQYNASRSLQSVHLALEHGLQSQEEKRDEEPGITVRDDAMDEEGVTDKLYGEDVYSTSAVDLKEPTLLDADYWLEKVSKVTKVISKAKGKLLL